MRRATTFAVLATELLVAAAQSPPDGPAMVVVHGPVSVRMGSPATERGRMPAPDSAAEPLHTVLIPRSFAISATEVERFQTSDVAEDREDAVLRVWDRDARTRRGGAFSYGAAFARSALRGPATSLPTNRRDNVGFRIARTVR